MVCIWFFQSLRLDKHSILPRAQRLVAALGAPADTNSRAPLIFDLPEPRLSYVFDSCDGSRVSGAAVKRNEDDLTGWSL